MTEEEKALFNAAIALAQYCKNNKNDCSDCIFSVETGGCDIGTPYNFKVPAVLCDKKE